MSPKASAYILYIYICMVYIYMYKLTCWPNVWLFADLWCGTPAQSKSYLLSLAAFFGRGSRLRLSLCPCLFGPFLHRFRFSCFGCLSLTFPILQWYFHFLRFFVCISLCSRWLLFDSPAKKLNIYGYVHGKYHDHSCTHTHNLQALTSPASSYRPHQFVCTAQAQQSSLSWLHWPGQNKR